MRSRTTCSEIGGISCGATSDSSDLGFFDSVAPIDLDFTAATGFLVGGIGKRFSDGLILYFYVCNTSVRQRKISCPKTPHFSI